MDHFQVHEPLTADEIDALCERLNGQSTEQLEPCACSQPGHFCCGVPGILARVENGQVAVDASVERCDLCKLYPSDATARAELVRRGMTPAP